MSCFLVCACVPFLDWPLSKIGLTDKLVCLTRLISVASVEVYCLLSVCTLHCMGPDE